MHFDLIVIGSGPAGYVAAIRAAQLGLKTAIVEKNELGGVCLNWGCIPTKSLLQSANLLELFNNSNKYGINAKKVEFNLENILSRSRNIVDDLQQGLAFLMKKNEIQLIYGTAKILEEKTIIVKSKNNKKKYKFSNLVIATGAQPKQLDFPKIPNLLNYKGAMSIREIPKNILIIGSGAIGLEFAYFYNAIGSKVIIVEKNSQILPNADREISLEISKNFQKKGIKLLTNSRIKEIKYLNSKKNQIEIEYFKNKDYIKVNVDYIISAIGVAPDTKNLGLENVGIKLTKNGHIQVNEYYETNIKNFYAIGDVIPVGSLAHVAFHEAKICVEQIMGLNPKKLNYNNIPMCIYTTPEIAFVGYSENEALEQGFEIQVGKFPFSALGKAKINGETEGFIKVIFDKKYGEWLGCHMIGKGVTELITEVIIARNLEATHIDVLESTHPHPSINESIVEAIENAYGKSIHF
ncbi:dihydrolipoyl dehydrogenase [Candidatus Karelsulcia muelleri]|uniref:Dihydrolipoyl dehydrogenase n=1 Tax=Candidatus Karelsulcia muelleri TaxID=336810 RepID=A0A346E137_9FLAO|nr:dihydrolipoyl dehydrogenase [Candidatus Karelsulcia muelleri]AXN02692.1 Dihydrolipoamide dehydrogenase [Candidatus Karelsulcia muelleri]WDI79485.1 dihydrolipoyl dehydrogenase [Candidatus Karelsulcia muelleri]WDR78943.1 dihydrolipoyl dehydrogenase [Candidatus Karelsulcia muelleri]